MRTERDGFSGLQRLLHWLMAIMVLTRPSNAWASNLGTDALAPPCDDERRRPAIALSLA